MRYLHFEKTIIEIMERLTDDLYLIGAEDPDLDLFENQYPVPDGITYNSYLLLDEQTAIFDTVDRRCGAKWLADLEEALGGRTPDYLIVHHMEPDHSACIADLLARYPSLRIVATERAIRMLPLYFADTDFTNRTVAVGEGGTLSLGRHTLRFLTAPMVHWPEVMVSYDETDRTLFSADAFGTFGIPSRGEARTRSTSSATTSARRAATTTTSAANTASRCRRCCGKPRRSKSPASARCTVPC